MADEHEGTPDRDRGAIEIEICPSKPEHLPAPETGRRHHHKGGVQPIALARGEETPGLISRPRVELASARLRLLGERGRVASDECPLLGSADARCSIT